MKRKGLALLMLMFVVLINTTGCEMQFLQNSNAMIKKPDQKQVSKKSNLVNTNLKDKESTYEDKEQLQKNIRELLFSKNVSGSVLVAKDNQVIFSEGIGYANKEKKLLNDASTTYPIGSISKLFLATSIMRLQEEKKLNIEDPVLKYIPNFPNGSKIKLYHLMTHTSGIQALHWHKGDVTPLNLIQEIEKGPIKFQPGTKWDYLDANYIVLGYILEKVTGTSLHDFIQKNILDQVPMLHTGFMTHEHPAPFTSIGYIMKNGEVEPVKFMNVYHLFACGDIYSTPYDMSLFDRALLNGKLVSKSSVEQMLTPGYNRKYGLGLYYNKSAAYSLGVVGGWYTMHAYFNDQTSVVVFLNEKDKITQIDSVVFQIYQMVKDYSEQQKK
ncbi:serine hydrolase [Paenibacillus sp. BSR1-1]|uniref:serine hydrolase domain-containing protein n=1 Tax=Paenibacillus sp. BSR1-1 TaxID=3020845 RepID=UPI0025B019A9|nr:serine hydrolase domain-containing protein [Paenibacillus sp. BSR1-1]MDN3018494.1 serine hydrolase [Paenibacillus sp. BSR1-1]